MKKRMLLELIIAGLLLLAEVITIIACYPEARSAASPDLYLTSIVAIFINLDVFYGVILLIVNGNRKGEGNVR